VTVLACHQVEVVFLDLVAYELPLGLVSVLDQRLQKAAPVVFEAQIGVLLSDVLD
jgi:hypothetical protein